MDDLWNEKLTRENFEQFYYSTVEMAYPSTYGICKETTRTENALIKSYIETYQQRSSIKAEDVIYVFGDILLKNANDMLEKYPLPDNLNYAPRMLDEYTRNSMLEKINLKIDSTGYKVAEFISSDNKKGKPAKAISKVMDIFPVTPLLVIQLLVLAIIIWLVSTASATLIDKDDSTISESSIFETVDLQDKYVAVLDYYPLNVDFPVTVTASDGEYVTTETTAATEEVLGPVLAETTTTEPSATRG